MNVACNRFEELISTTSSVVSILVAVWDSLRLFGILPNEELFDFEGVCGGFRRETLPGLDRYANYTCVCVFLAAFRRCRWKDRNRSAAP